MQNGEKRKKNVRKVSLGDVKEIADDREQSGISDQAVVFSANCFALLLVRQRRKTKRVRAFTADLLMSEPDL
jgi:hypothetical protein